jgi:hypothetical protein
MCTQLQILNVEVEANKKFLKWERKELGLMILILVCFILLALIQLIRRHRMKQQKLNEEIQRF